MLTDDELRALDVPTDDNLDAPQITDMTIFGGQLQR